MVAAAGAVALGLALATAGPGLGLAGNGGGSSTEGVQTDKPAPAGTGLVPATTNMRPAQGAEPPAVIPEGSTADLQPPATVSGGQGAATRVDRSDKGVKDAPPTKDLGTPDLPAKGD
jgi:hypothetical protein